MISILGGTYAPLFYFFFAIGLAAFAMEAWALVDAFMRPAGAFIAEGKQTKKVWLLILSVAAVVGLFGFLYVGMYMSGLSILFIAAFVAAAVYMADVRPKVKGYNRKHSGSSMGPYGPW